MAAFNFFDASATDRDDDTGRTERRKRNQLAAILMKQNAQPIASTAQGIGTVLLNGIGGYMEGREQRRLDEAEAAGNKALDTMMGGARAGASVAPGAVSSPPAGGSTLPTFAGGKTAMTMPGDSAVETRFVDTLRSGGLTNPVGLAAVAAYGNAESQYRPSNVTGSWSDPSQSGLPGTSGGTMSWRGSRLAAMRQFTASPAALSRLGSRPTKAAQPRTNASTIMSGGAENGSGPRRAFVASKWRSKGKASRAASSWPPTRGA